MPARSCGAVPAQAREAASPRIAGVCGPYRESSETAERVERPWSWSCSWSAELTGVEAFARI